jgi:hypothetical protein
LSELNGSKAPVFDREFPLLASGRVFDVQKVVGGFLW